MKRFDIMEHRRLFKAIINSWPPFLGAGIRVVDIAPDWLSVRVALRLRWYNRNYVRSHFGGSLFAMTDPFYMLLLLRNLGRDYVVWDMEAQIHYLRPGRGTVSAVFQLDGNTLAEIRARAAGGAKVNETFYVDVVDESGERVAAVRKTLYIRRKERLAADTAGAGTGTRHGVSQSVESGSASDRAEGGRGDDGSAAAQARSTAAATDFTADAATGTTGNGQGGSGSSGRPAPQIVAHSWGRIEVEGLGSGGDWQLWPGGGCPWDWRVHDTGHFRGVAEEDVEEVVERGATTVVIGSGRLGRLRVPSALVDGFAAQGVKVIVATTARGIAIYNDLARRGMAVGGLFHSTC